MVDFAIPDNLTRPIDVLRASVGVAGTPERGALDELAAQFAALFEDRATATLECERLEHALRLTDFCLDHAAVAVFRIGNNGRILSVNETACRSLGYSREELQSLSILDIDPDFDISIFTDHRNRLRLLGRVQFETRHRRKDGTTFPVEIAASYIEFEGESFSYAVARDISERRAAEEEARRNQARVEAIVATSPLGAHSYELNDDDQLILTSANPAADRILRIDHRPLIGKSIEDAFPALLQSETPRIYRQIALGAAPSTVDLVDYNEGRIAGVFELHAFQTDARKMSVFFRDITERRRSEEALRLSEERLRLAAQAGAIGFYDLDLQTGEMTGNEEYARMLGEDPASFRLTRQLWIDRIHPDDRPIVQEQFERKLRDGVDDLEFEFRILRPPDDWRWILSRGKIVSRSSDGTPLRILGTHVDVTARHLAAEENQKLEAQLHHAQKMESIGRLAGGVAHDFNNMLGVILGYSDLIRMKLPGDSPLLADLDEIVRAADRSRDPTRQLLAFSRRQVISPRPVQLNDLIQSLHKPLARLIGEDVELQFEPADDLWTTLVDPSQVDQILINLAVNARDAMPSGGSLLIQTANVSLDEAYCRDSLQGAPGDYVSISVSDSGFGMDRQTVAQSFEPFFTTKEAGKGTGLGLSTVYGIVKQNNGIINVYSEPGQGTVFRIYLPRIDGSARSAPVAPPTPGQSGHGTVLVVEDDQMVAQMTQAMLAGLGYHVLTASGGREALKILTDEPGEIDVLMTDVVMPGMNGAELCNLARPIRPSMGVLFVSGYTANLIEQHGVLQDGVLFLQKPFSRGALAEMLAKAIRNPPARPA